MYILKKKNKRNFFVWKDIEKVKSSFSKTNLIYKLQELLSKPNNIIDSNNNYNLILKTNYKRNYWIYKKSNMEVKFLLYFHKLRIIIFF